MPYCNPKHCTCTQLFHLPYSLLCKEKGYEFEPRGEIEVKGKGLMVTHFLLYSMETEVRLENEHNNFYRVSVSSAVLEDQPPPRS